MQLNNNKYIQLLNFEIKQQVETEGKLKYKEIITERTK